MAHSVIHTQIIYWVSYWHYWVGAGDMGMILADIVFAM